MSATSGVLRTAAQRLHRDASNVVRLCEAIIFGSGFDQRHALNLLPGALISLDQTRRRMREVLGEEQP
jgi:hypothetical protein